MGPFMKKPGDREPGEAKVLFAGLTPKAGRQTAKRDLEHEIRLDVNRPEGGTREVTIEATVPWDRPLRVGLAIPVFVSPSDPDYVEIDFDGIRSLGEAGKAAVDAAREGRPVTPGDLGFEPAGD